LSGVPIPPTIEEIAVTLVGGPMPAPSLRRTALAVGLLAALLAPLPALAAETTVVVRWNEALLQAVRNTGLAPMFTARALAVVHTSVYDAWAAYDDVAVGTRLGGGLRRPPAERNDANRAKAVSFAAYLALVDLFPTQRSALFDPLLAHLGYSASDTAGAAAIGRAAAEAVLAFRHADGSNQLGDHPQGTPGVAYSDYTGYQPVNDGATVVDPNHWQPLLNPNGTTQRFLAPHWGLVTPFALDTAGAFRPDPPPLFPHGLFRKEAREILHDSARLDDVQKVIALYWADGPNTETPPGHWNLFAQFVSARDAHTLAQDVKMFFALNNALLDAGIAVWECKRHFDYTRPVTAIRYLWGGKPVRAWAGPGLGTRLIDGASFRSYIATPPFAEYVSGHSTFSSSAAGVLRAFTGRDTFGGQVTFPAGASAVEPGLVPARPVTLRWRTFSEAADQAGISRRYGGIHFESGDLQGRALGRRIAQAVWAKASAYFEGTATP
jgi:hypothetical protein